MGKDLDEVLRVITLSLMAILMTFNTALHSLSYM